MRDTVLVSIDYNDKTKKGVLCVLLPQRGQPR